MRPLGKRKIDLKNKKTKLVFCHKRKYKRDYIMNYAKSLRIYQVLFSHGKWGWP